MSSMLDPLSYEYRYFSPFSILITNGRQGAWAQSIDIRGR